MINYWKEYNSFAFHFEKLKLDFVRQIVFVLFSFFMTFSLKGQVPDTSCVDAGIFCTLESLEGNYTLPEPFIDIPNFPEYICEDEIGGGQGRIQNILYFGFIANSNTVTLQINPIVCTPGNDGSGFHWGVIDGCELEDPEFVVCDGEEGYAQVTVTSDEFIPGHTYYLMIDGWAGSVCTFNIDVLTGLPSVSNPFEVDNPTHFSNDEDSFISNGDTIEFCQNGTLTTKVHGSTNNNGYIWSSPDPDGGGSVYFNSDADTLQFTFNETDSVYQFCTQAITDCDDSEEICFFVKVTTLPDDSLGVFEYCPADLASGIVPIGWECGEINNPGTYYCTLTDSITGCTQLQYVTIVRNEASIETRDTVICGDDPFYYNGDTILGDFFDKDYLFPGGSVNGCDSLLKFSVERMRFYGTLSSLSCLNDEEFGIEIEIDSIFPNDYDNVMVDWFLDDVYISTGMLDDLTLKVSEKGRYSATITVFKDGESCMFDLNEIEIDRFITADFTTSANAICIDDTLTVTLGAFNISASYSWSSGDQITEIFPGVYEITWDSPGVYDLELDVDFDGCQVSSGINTITVEPLLVEPAIQCVTSTNDSIYVEWTPVDCTSGYEVWLDGNLIINTNVPKFDFGNLEEDTDYEIAIIALSECLCPSTVDTTVCSTLSCPDNISLDIDQLPRAVCSDELSGNLQLTAQISGTQGGTVVWNGPYLDTDGMLDLENMQPGSYPMTLEYDLDNCTYLFTDTFTVYEPVEMDLMWSDISCYYNQDGMISAMPVQGTAPFTLYLNGKAMTDMEFTDLQEGMYTVEIVDGHSCATSMEIEIVRPAQPDLSIIGDTFIERGQSYDYQLTLENIDYDSVVWYVPSLDTVLCAGICDEINYAPLFNQDLCIELFYDENCQIDTCIHLTVNYDTHVNIPNVFTPGRQDGLNDYFTVTTNAYEPLKVLNFSIFDRWGEMLFHKSNTLISRSTDESFGWNGRYRGEEAMTGVYIYLIEIEDSDGNRTLYTGDLTLIR